MFFHSCFHRPQIILFVLFVLSVFFRFYCADFQKHFFIVDELLYYQFSENFAQNKGFLIYNLPSNFEKILYSIILSPAFLFENREVQQHFISFFNSVLISSTLFPAYYLAKYFLKQNKFIFIILFLTFIHPDLTYSVTFMSENCFVPLSLWCFYFSVLFIQKENPSILFSFSLGVLYFLAYLCKEIALFFPSTLFLYFLLSKFKCNLTPPPENTFKNLSLVLIIFILFSFFVHSYFFNSLNSFYTQQINRTISLNNVDYFLKGLEYVFYLFILNTIAAFVFPLLFPFVFYSHLNSKTKSAFVFLILLLLQTALVVAFKIYLLEDMDNALPRVFTRYWVVAWIPLFCFFFSIFEHQHLPSIHPFKWLIFIVPVFFILYYFKGAFTATPMDNTLLYVLNTKNVFSILLFKIILFFFLVFTILFFYKNNNNYKNYYLFVFLFFVFFSYILNNIQVYKAQKEFYAMNHIEKENIAQLENLVKQNPNKNFLFACDLLIEKPHSLISTYLNYPNVFITSLQDLIQNSGNYVHNYAIPRINYSHLNKINYNLKEIDYFIIPQKLNAKDIETGEGFHYSAEIYQTPILFQNEHFVIFENQSNNIIPPMRLKILE